MFFRSEIRVSNLGFIQKPYSFFHLLLLNELIHVAFARIAFLSSFRCSLRVEVNSNAFLRKNELPAPNIILFMLEKMSIYDRSFPRYQIIT